MNNGTSALQINQDSHDAATMPLRYAVEGFWLGSWWNKRNADTPEKALKLYYEMKRVNERMLEQDRRNGITTPLTSAYYGALRVRRNDGFLMIWDYTPCEDHSPALVILDKPTPVCPSALREAKAIFAGYGENEGRRFEAMAYSLESRIFQALDNGDTYHLKVTIEYAGAQAFTASFINGRMVSTQQWKISVAMAMKYSWLGYLPTGEAALAGAYEHLQALVLSGKA